MLGGHSKGMGSKRYTVAENAGNALLLGDRGMVSLEGSQNFRAFEPAICSRDVKPMLDKRIAMTVGCRLVRGKYQYRIYLTTGEVLSACILSPAAGHPAKECVVHAGRAAACGELPGGRLHCWRGLASVPEPPMGGLCEDVGTSFDGLAIGSALSLHFNHFKSPAAKKRYHKLTLELDCEDAVQIRFRQILICPMASTWTPSRRAQARQAPAADGMLPDGIRSTGHCLPRRRWRRMWMAYPRAWPWCFGMRAPRIPRSRCRVF